MSKSLYVADTTAIISCFPEVFGVSSRISSDGIKVIRRSIFNPDTVLLVIPSIAFVEIFDKWCKKRTMAEQELWARIISEVYKPIVDSDNIEIRPIDQELMEAYLSLDDTIVNLESHDKVALATAFVLKAPLITSDQKIKTYAEHYSNLVKIIS